MTRSSRLGVPVPSAASESYGLPVGLSEHSPRFDLSGLVSSGSPRPCHRQGLVNVTDLGAEGQIVLAARACRAQQRRAAPHTWTLRAPTVRLPRLTTTYPPGRRSAEVRDASASVTLALLTYAPPSAIARRPAERLGTTPAACSADATLSPSREGTTEACSSRATARSVPAGSSCNDPLPNSASAAATAARLSGSPWTRSVTSSASARCAARRCGASDVCRSRS